MHRNPLTGSVGTSASISDGAAVGALASVQQQRQPPQQPASLSLPLPSLIPCHRCAALEGELDAKGPPHHTRVLLLPVPLRAAPPTASADSARVELLLKRLSEGMQHWKVSLKERVRQQLQEEEQSSQAQATAQHNALLQHAVGVCARWRMKGQEVRLEVCV